MLPPENQFPLKFHLYGPELGLRAELMSIHGMNAFAAHNSASRGVMFASHFGQRLVINGAEEKIVVTGVCREMAKATFSVKMPADGRIIAIIDRYPTNELAYGGFKENPETVAIVETENPKEIRMISLPSYVSYHTHFGFRYKATPNIRYLTPGACLKGGTKFLESPAITENGGYAYGLNLNVAFMSIPGVGEDGVIITRKALQRMKYKVYEKRIVNFGSKMFPLNTYGDDNVYKIFPDIGDEVRADGILMAFREYSPGIASTQMSKRATRRIQYLFDKLVYARQVDDSPTQGLQSERRGRVVDIRVYRKHTSNPEMPAEMAAQPMRYYQATERYYRELLGVEERLRREYARVYRDTSVLPIKGNLHRELTIAHAVLGTPDSRSRQQLILNYRREPLDEWMVEFVVEYEVTPDVGSKVTCIAGGKGVITQIVEDENDMPVDSVGNRVDMIVDSASIIGRMNLGRPAEMYFNSVSREIRRQMRLMLGYDQLSGKPWVNVPSDYIEALPPEKFAALWQQLQDMADILDSKLGDYYRSLPMADKVDLVTKSLNTEVRMPYRINRDEFTHVVSRKLETRFKPPRGPVYYRGFSGDMTWTDDPVRIAPLYTMLLDKTTDEWNSLSTGTLQHFGLLSPLNREEKHSKPWRPSSTRTISETEGRIYAGYGGRSAMIEWLDRCNNPSTMKNMGYNLISAPNPSALKFAVDRSRVPVGGHKSLQLFQHMLFCSGAAIHYQPTEHFKLRIHDLPDEQQ